LVAYCSFQVLNFLTDAARNKYRVYQLNFIGEFLQANVRGRILVSLPKVFGDIWPEFKDFSGRTLEDLQEWLIEEEFMQSRASPCFFCIPSWIFHQNHYIYVYDKLFLFWGTELKEKIFSTLRTNLPDVAKAT
jgi:hypothetical protein